MKFDLTKSPTGFRTRALLAAALPIAAALAIAAAAAGARAGAPSARTSAGLELVGQIGGAAFAIEAETDEVFLAAGPSVLSFDAEPLSRPRQTGSGPVFGDVVRGLARSGDTLLVAAGRDGLVLLDEVNSELTVTRVITEASPAHGVAFGAGRAYVTVPGEGVAILDPRAPSGLLATIPVSSVVGPIEVTPDGWAVVLNSDGTALAIDARDVVSPAIGTAFGAQARSLDLDGEHLLLGGAAGLHVYSASDLSAPELLGSWNGEPVTAVLGMGDRAVAALQNETGVTLSLADPSAPSETARFNLAGMAAALGLSNGRLVAAVNRLDHDGEPYDLGGGLEVLEMAGARPTRRSLFELPSGRLVDMELHGGTVWAIEAPGAPGAGRAWSFDVRVPSSPRAMGSAVLEGEPYNVAVIPPHGFFTSASGMQLTITDPGGMLRPVKFMPNVRTGAADLASWAYHLWAADEAAGLGLYDATYPLDVSWVELTSNPEILGAHRIALADGRAYAAGEDGLAVLDVRDLEHPRTLARLTSVGPASGVATAGGIAVVANRMDGLRVVDARTTGAIGQVAHEPGPGLTDVATEGTVAYTLGLDGEVTVVDVFDPTSPESVAAISAPPLARDASGAPISAAGGRIAAAQDIAVVAHPFRGLLVYSASDVPGPTPTPIVDPEPVFLPFTANKGQVSQAHYTLARRGVFDPFNSRPHGFAVDDALIGVEGGQSRVVKTAFVGMEGGVRRWLATVDLTDPALPVLIGESPELACTLSRITTRAGLAYGACGHPGGLQILDVKNPLAPVRVVSYTTQAELVNLALMPDGRHVVGLESLGGSGSTSIVTYDVTDPAHPREAGRLALTEGVPAPGLTVRGTDALVTGAATGVMTVRLDDVTDPRLVESRSRAFPGAGEAAMRRASSSSASRDVFGLVNRGSESLGGGLWLLAAADGLPEVGSLVSIDWPDVQGGREASWYGKLLVTASEDDVDLYDVTNPAWPRLSTQMLDTFQDVHELLLQDGFVYLTDPSDGLVVIEVIPDR